MNITDIALEEQQEDQEITEPIDELADFTADLVSLKQTEPFLHKLFSKNSGTWVDVFALCADVKQVKPRIDQLQSALDGSLLYFALAGFVILTGLKNHKSCPTAV